LLCDTTRSIGLAYGACEAADAGYPARITYIIDERGVITHTLEKVDPKSHTDDVLNEVA
jgi:peroxiredoxin